MVKKKQEGIIEDKKIRKEKMENDDVVMCHSLQNTGELQKY